MHTSYLIVRMASIEEAGAIADYRRRNEAHLVDHYPTWTKEALTEAYWQHQVRVNLAEFDSDESVRLVIFEKEKEDTIIGTINFTSILRRAAQYCVLGYGLDEKMQGRGYMTEALSASIDFVFKQLNLHRIMANYVPTNERSGRVLRRLGFSVEGYARDYLYLNGAWRDHILTALINPDWQNNQ